MKATVLNLCFWALVPLAFSATDSTKEKHIAVAIGNNIVTYDYDLIGSPRVSPNVTEHNISLITYDPINDTLIGVSGFRRAGQWVDLFFRYDPKSNQVHNIMEWYNDKVIWSIAFDYLGNNLYMSTDKKIQVYSLTTGEKTEISYKGGIPYGMTLIPEEGIMFVVLDDGLDSRIVRAKMNGAGPTENVHKYYLSGGKKTSLAYDKDSRRMFWVHENNDLMYYAENAGHIEYFRQGLNDPIDIAILGDKIFWTSRDSSILSWTDKKEFELNIQGQSVHIELPWIKDEELGAPHLQSMESLYTREMINNTKRLHPCSQNNGGCSHVCLVTDAKNRLCACPSKFYLGSDMKTCTPELV